MRPTINSDTTYEMSSVLLVGLPPQESFGSKYAENVSSMSTWENFFSSIDLCFSVGTLYPSEPKLALSDRVKARS